MHKMLVLAAAMSLGGCASIVRGTDEPVAFQSYLEGAEVRLSSGLGCPATPCAVLVPRKDAFVATFAKEGFHQEQIHVGTKVGGGGGAALAGNALFGGIIGVVVDASNGAQLDHDPNPVITHLKPLGEVSRPIERRQRNRVPSS
jgi:hypothetical protein